MAEHAYNPSHPAPVAAGVGGKSTRTGLRRGHPQARTVRKALDALQRMPAEAVADLVERLVDRLDALEPDLDLEEEHDCCPAGDDGSPCPRSNQLGVGDETDAEESGDEHEPDDDDMELASEEVAIFPRRRHPEPQEDLDGVRQQLEVVIARKRAANGAWEAWA